MVLSPAITEKIKSVLKANPQGLSITDIVSIVDLNRNTAGRYLENLLVSGHVEMRQLGMAKIYTLSQRVPVSAVLSISSELIMQLDKNLRIVFANEPFLSFLSVSSTDLFGKNLEYSRVLPVFEEIYTEFVGRIRNGIAGTEWSGEFTLKERGIIFSCHFAPTVFDNGQKGVSVILEDITGKKRADEMLREYETRFQAIIDNMQDAYFRADRNGRIIMASRSAARIFRYGSADEMIGISAALLYREPQIREDLIRRLTEQGVVQDFICEAMRKDGTGFWVSMNVQFVLDEDGKIAGTDGFVRDITERQIAQDALRESEERYRTIFENTGSATVIIEENNIISLANAEFEHLSGFLKKELEGQVCWTEFVVKEDLEKMLHQHTLRRIDQGKALPQYEFRFITRSGKIRNIFLKIDVIPGTKKSVASLLDITELKQADLALRESEEKYRTLVERSNDGICIVQDDIIKLCNPAIAAFWGGSADEILGRNFSDFIHPDAVEEVVKLHTMRIAGETVPTTYETILQRKNGSRFFAEVNSGICPFEGKPANHVVIRDVSDRKKAAEALRESEEKYRTIFENAGDAIAIHDFNGNFIEVNDIMCRRVGYSREELLNKMVGDVDNPDHARNIEDRIRELTKKGHTIFETVHITREGEQIPTEVSSVLFHLDNKPLVMSVARDITKRKQAEDALKKSEERFRDLINTIADMVWQTDTENRFVYVSPQVERILGYTPEELIGHTPFKFLEPESIELNRLVFETAVRTHQQVFLHESRWIDRDGNVVVMESHATPVYNSDGTFTGFRGIDRDITDR